MIERIPNGMLKLNLNGLPTPTKVVVKITPHAMQNVPEIEPDLSLGDCACGGQSLFRIGITDVKKESQKQNSSIENMERGGSL